MAASNEQIFAAVNRVAQEWLGEHGQFDSPRERYRLQTAILAAVYELDPQVEISFTKAETVWDEEGNCWKLDLDIDIRRMDENPNDMRINWRNQQDES